MRDVNRAVAISGWVVILLVCVSFIGIYLWLMLTGQPVPEDLRGDAKMSLGFLFGAGAALVKEVMMREET